MKSKGRYRTTKDLNLRTTIGRFTLESGTIININQIDHDSHEVISKEPRDRNF